VDAVSSEEIIDAAAHDAGVSVVTQRGAVIGLEFILTEDGGNNE